MHQQSATRKNKCASTLTDPHHGTKSAVCVSPKGISISAYEGTYLRCVSVVSTRRRISPVYKETYLYMQCDDATHTYKRGS